MVSRGQTIDSGRSDRRQRGLRIILRCACVLAGLLAGTAAPGIRTAHAQLRPPWTHNGIYYRNYLAIRYNPLGLFNELRVGYKHRLSNTLTDTFRQGSYVGFSVVPTVSPAWLRMGALLELQPLSVLNLSAQYDYAVHFGTFDTVQSYNSPNAAHSDADQDAAGALRQNYRTTSHHVTLAALFQVRLGNIAVRSNTRAVWNSVGLMPPTHTVYYDIYFDVLAANNSWLLLNDTDVLYQTDWGLTVGVRYSFIQALYPAEAYAAGDDESLVDPNTPISRVGPLIAYQFYESRRSRFNAPTVFLLANWHLFHRYRTGGSEPGAISQAMPYLAVGLSFRGELFGP